MSGTLYSALLVLHPGHLLEDPRVAGGLDITPQHGFYHLDTLDNSPECW